MSYLLAFLGFAALIILHEAGHFVAAKAVGMRVERFSLFFGPMIIKRRWGETVYGVGVVPLGGYVKIAGMNPNEILAPEHIRRAYYNQAVWKRVVTILAGPAVNIAIAFVIAFAVLMSSGQQVIRPGKLVASTIPSMPAVAKLRPGDRIVSVDGVGSSVLAIQHQTASHACPGTPTQGCYAKRPASVVVERGGRRLHFEIRPRMNGGRMELGFEFATRDVYPSAGVAATSAASWLWSVSTQTASTVARVFEPQERRQLSGVVGVYTVAQESFATSTTLALDLLALISLSLGVINLFPFLPLDGGHIFWALAEKVRGKRIPFRVMERAGIVGFALIVLLFAIGLSNDISTLSGPGFPIH
ncbi:MAG: M50 family metallopeptidase [Solirubrobacteraceae bacterium]